MKNICFQMSRKAVVAFSMLLCSVVPALAQKVTVTGQVNDSQGDPLIGASVIPQGQTAGVITDIDGRYSITVDKAGTLVFSYIGFNTVNEPVNGRSTINVTLSENSVMLGEVVAIGYGSIKKSDATGSVAMVKPDEIAAGLATSAQDLLVGASPGVVVTTDGGQPQGGAKIVIRGGSSLAASNEPLVVIDGVPMDTKTATGSSNALSMINPENIESMTILKDASATAIFGSRASNGVIIITTKKGKKGKPEVTFTANMYIHTPRNYMNMMSADQYRQFITDNYGVGSTQYNALGNYRTDWQKGVIQSTVSSDYSLSVGGAIKNLPYRVSASWTGNNGIVRHTGMDRATVGINLSPKFFDDLLTVNANVRGAWISNEYTDMGAMGNAVSFNPTLPVRDPNGNAWNGWTTYAAGANGNTIDQYAGLNPIAMIDDYSSKSYVLQSVGNLQLDLAMPFLRDLHANLNLGYEISRSHVNNITATNSPMAWKGSSERINPTNGEIMYVQDGVGKFHHERQMKINTLLDFYLNYRKDVASIKSGFDVTAGYSYQKFRWQSSDFTTLLDDGSQPRPTSRYRSDLVLASFFGRLNYTFMDRYLLTVSVREDGTSRFSKRNRWGTFPSAALAWKVLDENFMEDARGWLNELKLRAGFGITGQQDLGGDYFPYLPVYVIGNNGNPGTNQWAYPNPNGSGWVNPIKPSGYNTDIKWEETQTWNAGIDFGFMNNRIAGSVDFYKRKTKDLLTYTVLPAGSNLTNNLNTNIGDMENIGVEFNITARPVVNKNFTWTTGFNIAWNKNKITRLSYGDDPNYFMLAGEGISAGTGGQVQAHKIGLPAYSYLVFQQVYDINGDPIEGQFVDRNGDGQITDADKYFYKSKDPKVTMSWTNNFNYKNWDFSFTLRSNIGNYVYANSEASNVSMSATSTVPLSNLMADKFIFEKLTTEGIMSDYFVRNASFVRCDNITLGYTWPALLNNKMRLRLYGAVQNPFVITKYSGLDPEVFSGIDKDLYPRPITVSFGVVASF